MRLVEFFLSFFLFFLSLSFSYFSFLFFFFTSYLFQFYSLAFLYLYSESFFYLLFLVSFPLLLLSIFIHSPCHPKRKNRKRKENRPQLHYIQPQSCKKKKNPFSLTKIPKLAVPRRALHQPARLVLQSWPMGGTTNNVTLPMPQPDRQNSASRRYPV